MLIDGARELTRALQAGVEVLEVFVCEELCLSDQGRKLLETLAAPVAHGPDLLHVSRAVFEKLAFGSRAEGVVGVARTPSTSLHHVGESAAADSH